MEGAKMKLMHIIPKRQGPTIPENAVEPGQWDNINIKSKIKVCLAEHYRLQYARI